MATPMENKLRTAQDDVLKSAERVISDVSENASEYANNFLASAQDWIETNPGRAITALGLFAAVGVAAYLLGRSSMSSRFEIDSDTKAA